MSIRPSRRVLAQPAQQDTDSVKSTNATPIERTRPAASLDAWLARDWSQAVSVATLEEFQQINVCTQNTLYELVIVSTRGDIRVRGGRYFPEWTAARLAGCTSGGSFLKRLTISLGLQMEIECDGRRIVTSPVRTIAVLEHRPVSA
jgi:hypothetical protein